MLLKITNLVPLFLLIWGSACSDPAAAQQKAWQSVMAIHDEIMPWMGEMNSIAKEVKSRLADETLSEAQSSQLQAALASLDSADATMWKWMNGLKQLDKLQAEETHEAIMDYLMKEEAAIIALKDQMKSSMEEGKAALAALSSTENSNQ